MKNSSITEQLELQEQNFTCEKKKEIFQSSEKENMISCNFNIKADDKHSYNQKIVLVMILCYLSFHLEMKIITMQHWLRNYTYRNTKRSRRDDCCNPQKLYFNL